MKRKTPDLNFTNLKGLAEEPHTKRMNALRLVSPRLRRALYEERETRPDIQRQSESLGITSGYKLFQTYVNRLRNEDQLRNRQAHTLQSTSQQPKAVPAAGEPQLKPIAFVIPATAGAKSLGLFVLDLGLGHPRVPVQPAETRVLNPATSFYTSC